MPSSTRHALLAVLAAATLLFAAACSPTEGAIGANRDLSDVDFGDNNGEDTSPDVEPDATNNAQPDVVEDDGCSRDADCTDELCIVHRDDGEHPTACDSAAGAGGFGDACTTDADCQSNLCEDGRCTGPCGSDADCPDGFRCASQMLSDAVTLDICVPDTCGSLGDCGAPEVCQANRGEQSLDFTCHTQANADGGDLGSSCTEDADCATNFCEGGRCSAPCVDDGDCDADLPMTCQTQSVEVEGGSVDARICVGPDDCDRSADCTDPNVCFFLRTPAELVTTCDDGNPTPGHPSGYLCNGDTDCLNGLCLNGQCAEPCVATADCPTGLVCGARVVTLDEGNMEVSVCVLPPEDACARDADCTAPDLCVARRRGDRIDFVCGDGNDGGGDTGDTCTTDADCSHNLCLSGECTAPCGVDSDCSAANGELCATLRATVELGTVNVNVCTFPEPCLAARQCDMNTTCYVRQLANDAIDTVCLPPNSGGRGPGGTCTEDVNCAANLCLTDWLDTACSVPCETNADCTAPGYTCQSRQLTASPDSTTTVCVPPDHAPCQASSDCAGNQLCSIVVNRAGDGLETVCIAPVGGGAAETACTTDADCRTGICLLGTCSAVCQDRAADCGANQICESNTVTEGNLSESFNLCRTLADTPCEANDQCDDGVRVCGNIRFDQPNTAQPYCTWPRDGGDPIGTACTGTRSPNDQCYDRICLTPYTNECTTTCVDNQDCADAGAPGGFICTDFRLNSDTVRMCAEGCPNDDSCVRNNHLCALSRNVTDDRFEFICRSSMGDDPPGTDCSQTINCDHGICLIRRQNNMVVEQVCTLPCITDADCPVEPANPWVCGDATIARPSSSTSQTLRVCTRQQ